MKTALITGNKGFVGTHLNDHLVSQGWRVVGYDAKFNGQDLQHYEHLRGVLDRERPDAIFHLAAQAFVAESFSNPGRTFRVNTLGSLNLLEAVRQLGIKTKIHLAGTSEEYGDGDPSEDAYLEPKSPYAISKVAMDQLGVLYAKAYGMHIVVTRAFNHTGPGRGEMYAESAFAKQIVEIENGDREILEHGNLETIRNYTDVRDIVRGYAEAINLPSGVYNICSNQNVSIQHVLDTLVKNSNVEVKTQVNQSLYRPSDFSFKEPNCEKFQALTGWKPTISLEETMSDILDDWRMRLA